MLTWTDFIPSLRAPTKEAACPEIFWGSTAITSKVNFRAEQETARQFLSAGLSKLLGLF